MPAPIFLQPGLPPSGSLPCLCAVQDIPKSPGMSSQAVPGGMPSSGKPMRSDRRESTHGTSQRRSEPLSICVSVLPALIAGGLTLQVSSQSGFLCATARLGCTDIPAQWLAPLDLPSSAARLPAGRWWRRHVVPDCIVQTAQVCSMARPHTCDVPHGSSCTN